MRQGLATTPVSFLSRYRDIFLRTTAVEIRALYAGSALGLAWVLLGPLILLVLYSVVYVMIFRIQPPNMGRADYVLYVFAGLIPTIAFSTALTHGANALVTNRQVLLNTVFPAELLPLRATVVQSVPLPVALALVAVIAAVLKGGAGPALLVVPLLVVLQVMFVAGIAWVLALVTLALRDMQQLLQYITLVLLIITPIAYTPDMIPPTLGVLVKVNPLYFFVSAYQAALVFGSAPSVATLAVCTALGVFSFWGGFWLFQRVKLTFYDYA